MRSVVRSVVIAALAVALLAVFLRNADVAGVWLEIRRADLALLGLAVASVFVNMVIRAVRWQVLLAPIGGASFGNAFRTTVIGFGASFLLPARAGEVIRPYLLARHEACSATAAFATVVVERLLDLLSIVALLAAFVLLFDPGMADRNQFMYDAVRVGGLTAAGLGAAVLAAMVAVAGRPALVVQTVGRLERVLPWRLAAAIARLAGLFVEGLAVAREPARLAGALAWSLLLWLCIAVGIWATAEAFRMGIPFQGTFLIAAMLVVGVAVPTPGGVGGFHEAFRLGATAFYAAPNDRAVGAAIVLHVVTFVPVTLLGLAFLVREGISVRGIGQLARTAKAEEKAGEVPILRASGR